MFYISIQQVDYDEYPLGQDTKIGPFESFSAAEQYLENNSKFYKAYYMPRHFQWKDRAYGARGHLVKIKDLSKTHMIHPEDY